MAPLLPATPCGSVAARGYLRLGDPEFDVDPHSTHVLDVISRCVQSAAPYKAFLKSVRSTHLSVCAFSYFVPNSKARERHDVLVVSSSG